MFEFIEDANHSKAVIKVVGVGGGGGNALRFMIDNGLEGVEFICANTDAQALERVDAPISLRLGEALTHGLGAGANPEMGRQAADQDRNQIAERLKGSDMVFITAGMGGGTGTGAAPVIAEVARDLDILSVAVVTRPFAFEGRKRIRIAEDGISRLQEQVDSLIVIPNDKLGDVLGKAMDLKDAFGSANEVLLGAVRGIADIIIRPGLINVDFADICTTMRGRGRAVMGAGSASGEERARKAADAAIHNPLLEEQDMELRDAKGVLVNVAAANMTLGELHEVGDLVQQLAAEDGDVIVGSTFDETLGDDLRVTVVAAGFFDGLRSVDKPELKEQEAAQAEDSQQPEKEAPELIKIPGLGGSSAGRSGGVARGGGRQSYNDLDVPAWMRRQSS